MNCPSCSSGSLGPAQLEAGLPCQACSSCQGALLALSPYLDWLKAGGHEAHAAAPHAAHAAHAQDSKRALLCPGCARIMVKFKVLADAAHSLDFCFSCEHVWLDAGEWDYLKEQDLHTRITAISTEAWQRHIREELGSAIRTDKYRHELGEAAFAEAQRFKRWLETQPQRDEILRYLALSEPARH